MAKPTLLIVAGCNGSGKSTYSRLLVSTNFIPFDYDHYYIQYYRTLIDSDFKETMAHNMAWQTFEDQINNAIRVQGDFCFETNFNSTPLH